MDIIQELKSKNLLDYIEGQIGEKASHAGSGTYRFKHCPICGKGDHFNINTHNNLWNTFGNCGGGSIIDFYMTYFGADKQTAIKELCNDFNINFETKGAKNMNKENIKTEVKQVQESAKTTKEIDLTSIINNYYTLSKSDYMYFGERLLKNFEYEDKIITDNFNRLVSTNKFLVGDPKEIFKDNLNLVPGLYNINSYEYVIPVWENGKVVNCILRRNDKKSTENKKTLNLKGPRVRFINGDHLKQPKGFIFITEGIFDCLSIECLGYKSICLNSVHMANKMITLIKSYAVDIVKNEKGEIIKETPNNYFKDTKFILALDNDTDGVNATKKLSEGLTNLNIDNFSLTVDSKYKDINEYYLNDLDGLRDEIEICTKNINKNSALHFLDTGFYKTVDKYVNYQKKRTGFKLLDENLDGLMPALYILGAGSSLGKTTFMLQMADNIARNGNDVLYFSLEQSKFELISKSLSRTAWVELNEKVTAKQVMYNTDSEITSQCIDLYRPTAERLFIYEGNFNTTVKDIESKINSHISLTGNKPVVIIDYLQVVQSEIVGMSDKALIDNMVTTLKRISRNLFIPIFVISSLNRANYQNPMSYESFKESGSIEYTADVLLGLQYSIVHEIQGLGEKKITQKRAEMKRAISGDKEDNYRRDIELVALKNRSGKQTFNISFSFYPGLNYFHEKENQEEELTQFIL